MYNDNVTHIHDSSMYNLKIKNGLDDVINFTDWQKEIVDTFNRKGYIIGLNGVEELENAIKRISEFNPNDFIHNNMKMLSIIEDFIDNIDK